jgi:hypothetical protein
MNRSDRAHISSKATTIRRLSSGSYLCSLVPALLVLAFIWPFSGGKDVQMTAGELNPAARATIHLHVGDNNNTELDIKAESLAAPSALTPPKTAYVVWIDPPDAAPQNHGQITVSKDQKAELKTATPYKRFKIYITAENQARIQSPEGPTILSADVTEGKK